MFLKMLIRMEKKVKELRISTKRKYKKEPI